MNEPEVYEAKLDFDGGVRRVRQVTEIEAILLRKDGIDVVVCGGSRWGNRTLAQSIEAQANGKWKRELPHERMRGKALPHYQPHLRGPTGHTFYETEYRKAIG